MEKSYNPKSFEDEIYKEWEEEGCFRAERDDNKVPFTIMMPPPNITGQLHMGHALDETYQDTLIRFKRMQGYCALWLPGTDHASIATEVKIVEQLKKQGINKEDLTREEFLKLAWDWKEKYGGRIVTQLKKLGSSCDWSRLAFTMDEKCSRAVREVFVNLYNKGLIYHGNRIINWCPECKTALSDAEVEYVDEDSHFWHIKYFLEGSDTEGLIVATTRPETMFGDTAVAVNPNDERYKSYIGKNVILPIINKPIPVVADEHADMEYGTGCVKITPAHDPNDFEVGLRHNLPLVKVMNEDGTMNSLAGKYDGMDRYECRKAVVEELKELGNLVKIEPHTHSVGHCYRCHTAIEPMVSKQWFVKMNPLARPAINAVMDKKTTFIPERFAKIYFNWMENVKDWCISRQLWWGHRIPIWYCDDCGHGRRGRRRRHFVYRRADIVMAASRRRGSRAAAGILYGFDRHRLRNLRGGRVRRLCFRNQRPETCKEGSGDLRSLVADQAISAVPRFIHIAVRLVGGLGRAGTAFRIGDRFGGDFHPFVFGLYRGVDRAEMRGDLPRAQTARRPARSAASARRSLRRCRHAFRPVRRNAARRSVCLTAALPEREKVFDIYPHKYYNTGNSNDSLGRGEIPHRQSKSATGAKTPPNG